MGLVSRRTFMAGIAAAASASTVRAQAWPAKPIRIVVGFAAGTPPDTFARLYGEFVGKRLGVPVVIENKAGAAGNLATDAVAKSAPDGYTFLYNVANAFTVNPFLYSKLPFNPDKDLVPVATSMSQGLVLVANNQVAANSLGELLQYARQNPGKISYASYGAGSYPHLMMEWVLEETHTQMLHVPYRSTPMNELIGGQVQVMIEPIATAYQFISSGRVKALAYTGAQRHPALPKVQTFGEVVPGVSLTAWHGIWAPARTPQPAIERFNAEMVSAAKDPEIAAKIRALQCEPLAASPAEIARMVQRDAAIFGRIVKAKNIKLD